MFIFSELLEALRKNGMSAGSEHNGRDENVRNRSANASKKSDDYTPEQLEAVKK